MHPCVFKSSEKHINSILMTRHYRDMGNFSDWSCRVGNLIQPIRSTTQIWVVTRHQYGISALVSHTSFGGETSGSVFTGYLIFRTLEVLSESQIWFVYKGFYKWHLLNSMTDDLMFRSKTKGLRTMYGNYPQEFVKNNLALFKNDHRWGHLENATTV